METFVFSVLDILITLPGNLIYYLTLIMSCGITLQFILVNRKLTRTSDFWRILMGIGMILISQLGVFFSSGFAWYGYIDAHQFLPPLDRAALAFSLTWIIWIWTIPSRSRWSNLAIGLLDLVIIGSYFPTVALWQQVSADQMYNASLLARLWEVFSALIALGGISYLIVMKTPGWEYGITMLATLFGGFFLNFIISDPTRDLSGMLRIAHLCAYPLLPAITFRLIPQKRESHTQVKPPPEEHQPVEERKSLAIQPRAVLSWLFLTVEKNLEKLPAEISRAIGQTLLAGYCYLVGAPDETGTMALTAGYDAQNDDALENTAIQKQKAPQFALIVQDELATIMDDRKYHPEVSTLCTAVGEEGPRSILYAPLKDVIPDVAGVILISPDTEREWRTTEKDFLQVLIDFIKQITGQRSEESPSLAEESSETAQEALDTPLGDRQEEIDQLEWELNQSKAQLTALQREYDALIIELENLRQEVENPPLFIEENAVPTETPAPEQLDASPLIMQQMQQLEQEVKTKTEEISQLEKKSEKLQSEFRMALEEITQLQTTLSEASLRADDAQKAIEVSTSQESLEKVQEVISSMTQELRQPLFSFIGFTDLLLSESVGDLGTLQQKFLERMKASAERLQSLIRELNQYTSHHKGKRALNLEEISLAQIVDAAVESTSGQIRLKNISLRVDLPEHFPQIITDREILTQVFISLLQNACMVTANESSITLVVRPEQNSTQPALLVQVTDLGGGISPDDLKRVFEPQFQAGKPLIGGLGDANASLAITKELIESLGGRIWLESDNRSRSTFSAIVPFLTREEEGNLLPE